MSKRSVLQCCCLFFLSLHPSFIVGAHNPVLAETILQENKADLIAHGRQSFCDPELPSKVAAGKIKDIRACTRCNTLRALGDAGGPRCPLTPVLGREYAMSGYQIGPRRKDEPLMPRGLVAGMPVSDRSLHPSPGWLRNGSLWKKGD